MNQIRLVPFISLNIFFTLALLSFPVIPDAKQPSVEEIVKKTNQMAYYQGEDGRARVSMVITDSQGRKRNRLFIILRMDEKKGEKKEKPDQQETGEQRLYVYFLRPADVNKMVFMVWKQMDRDDDRWLYLPALDLVKRIAATDKRTSFAGSDFYYEDVSGRNTEDDIHELVQVTDTYYVLKNTPKDTDTVEFSYFTMWIHKGTFLPIKTVFYDKRGKEHRIYEALKVEKIQGFPTVVESRMRNVKDGGETLMTYSKVEYNLNLPADIFTERYLRRAPRKYLK